MISQRKDFLEQLIEQTALVIAKILHLEKSDDEEKIAVQINDALNLLDLQNVENLSLDFVLEKIKYNTDLAKQAVFIFEKKYKSSKIEKYLTLKNELQDWLSQKEKVFYL